MFSDRADAGRRLAEELASRLAPDRFPSPVVLGLPRGGVPVAYEVARRLGAPLDVIVVRKLGVPDQPELAMGAIGEDGVRVLNDEVLRRRRPSPTEIEEVEQHERQELETRVALLRGSGQRVPLHERTAVVVDDGVATGATARAACEVARAHGAARVIVAVPVAAPDAVALLAEVADDVVCLEAPRWLSAVGEAYEDFRPVPDAEVRRLLDLASESPLATSPASPEVLVDAGPGLPGLLTPPTTTDAVVLFAHGSGSSRLSPRNRQVAEVLSGAGLGTLLFDLLTDEEARDRSAVFDVDLLAGRLLEATAWTRRRLGDPTAIGYFGASTGAAAALWAAADPAARVSAVVSRGGRPDLAGPRLGRVTAPTLLLVGGNDETVLALNRRAQSQMAASCELVVVPGATHLFEEPGTLAEVSLRAKDWFVRHLAGGSSEIPRATHG